MSYPYNGAFDERKTYIRNIDGTWYAFGSCGNGQVCSIGADDPDESTGGYKWIARWSDAGIKYVASPSPSRNAAYRKAARAGRYCGEG